MIKKMKWKRLASIAMAFVMLTGFGAETNAAANKVIDAHDKIDLWIGDSRSVLIYQDLMYTNTGVAYGSKLAKKKGYIVLKYGEVYAGRGTGFNFMRGAHKKITSIVKKPGRQNIVFASGVNDMWNPALSPYKKRSNGKVVAASPETLAKAYWKWYYKKYITVYKDDHFYLMSVNPMYTNLYAKKTLLTNSKVVRFNNTLKKLAARYNCKNVTYVDTYKMVFVKSGMVHKISAYRYAAKYRKLPGLKREKSCYQLHYSTTTNQKIFNYVNNVINKEIVAASVKKKN